jgi:hypothetical protein
MENKYHHYLNLPFKLLPPLPMGDNHQYPQQLTITDYSLIDPKLTDWLKNLGLEIFFAEVFYIHPETKGHSEDVVHLDGMSFNDHIKINFVYTDTFSLMNWYKIKDESKFIVEHPEGNTSHYVAQKEDCDLLYSAQITHSPASLVNAGVLHNITNVNSPRYCFSFIPGKIGTENFIFWPEAIKIFKDYIIGA